MDNQKEIQLKSEAWDIVYPALIFLCEAQNLPPSGWETIKQAIKHSYLKEENYPKEENE